MEREHKVMEENMNGNGTLNKKNGYNQTMPNMRDYWVSKEKKEIFLNMKDEDKEKLIQLVL